MEIIRRIAEPFKHVEVRVVDENGAPVDHYVVAPGDDYSMRGADVVAACDVLHTPEIVAAYVAHIAAQE